MRTTLNPEWVAAPYALRFMLNGVVQPENICERRFKEPPPANLPPGGLLDWAMKNEIPQFIEVADEIKPENMHGACDGFGGSDY